MPAREVSMSKMTKECREAGPLLIARADGTLAPDRAARVDAHVAGCDDCRRELELLRAETGWLRDDPMPAVPAGLAGRVMAGVRFRPGNRHEEPQSTPVRMLWRVVALVLFAAGVTIGALAGNAISRPVPDDTDHITPMMRVLDGSRPGEGL